MVLTITIVFFVGGAAYASIPQDQPAQVYSSASRVLLVESSQGANSDVINKTATNTAIDLLASSVIQEKVAQTLGIPSSEFTESVELFGTANPDSNVLVIIATSENAELPSAVTQSAAELITSEAPELLNVDAQIVEDASPAQETIDLTKNTSLVKIAIPTVLGLLLGLFIAFVRAWANNTVYSAQELLGMSSTTIISVRSRTGRKNEDSLFDEDDVRKVRSQLLPHASALLFVNETTDTDFNNFVASFVASVTSVGNKALVIDCDLKSPSALGLFTGVASDSGIRSGMKSATDFNKSITAIDPGLNVLPSAGVTAHPEDVLGTKQFKQFVEKAQSTHDFVLLMCPSVTQVSSAAVLAEYVESAVVITETGVTQLASVSQTVNILDQSAVNSISVVVLESKLVKSKETSGR